MMFNFYDCENCLTVFAVATDIKEVLCPNPECGGKNPSLSGHAELDVPVGNGAIYEDK